MKEYVLAPAAVEDLDEIWLHIARDSIDAAERVLDELEAACELLSGRPHAGHIREELADASVKFWSVGSYLVVYRPDRVPLEIIRFWHGAERDAEPVLMYATDAALRESQRLYDEMGVLNNRRALHAGRSDPQTLATSRGFRSASAGRAARTIRRERFRVQWSLARHSGFEIPASV